MQSLKQNPPNKILLYADDGYLSHQVRLVLLEKQLDFDEIHVQHHERFTELGEDLADLNPYHTLPIMVYRELILYQNMVIFEYLEDRYHQYKLLPENPTERASYRQLLWRINHDWIQKADILLTHPDSLDQNLAKKTKHELTNSLTTLAPLFVHKPFFLSDTFGLCDCVLASILCRLNQMQIQLPVHLCRPLLQYQQRIFSRDAFKKSQLLLQI
ncbi:stringent starvation protein A [Moraxella macacae 0408225]|uniref:Stringent starvation protein A n=1 Tax=Moraxella macacae 0408225 TaxID=1230338 RepID=L2F734_9GAMM|nr:glutathione S-transferase N-terminal domain-containing protein [Moraxella macacae]ELA08852.1 stringent starvation protein A [Moraxella macacae 0408225]